MPLDLFVLFSSAASLLGSPGPRQLRRRERLPRRPGPSPPLGKAAGAERQLGFLGRGGHGGAAKRCRRPALVGGRHRLDRARARPAHAGAADRRRSARRAGVLPIDWPKFFERIPGGQRAGLAARRSPATPAPPFRPPTPVRYLLEELKPPRPPSGCELALTHIRQQAARVLAIDDANLPDPRRTLNELGFDSLTGVEFANRVGRSIGQQINPALLVRLSHAGEPGRLRGARHAPPGRAASEAGLPLPRCAGRRGRRRCNGNRRWPTSKACRKRKWTPW